MIVAEVRRLAQAHTLKELQTAADQFAADRANPLNVQGADEGEIMSNLLAAAFVRERMDEGLNLNEAVREYSRRVRSILS